MLTPPTMTSLRKPRPPVSWSVRLMRLAVRTADALAPPLAARIAEHLWRHPPRHRPPPHEQAWVAQATSSVLLFRGRALAVYAWGRGPTILLVHGWSGRGSQLGAFAAPLVAAGYRVVAFDAPAHGRSPGYTTSALEIAAALRALADDHGRVRGIIAHSFGTLVTLLALKDGLRTERVVCISAPASVRALFTRYTQHLGLSPRTVRLLRERVEHTYGQDIWARTDSTQLATRTDVPGLVIHDRDDRDVPCQEGAAIAQAWRGAQWVETEALGHRRILRDPDVVTRAVAFMATGPEAG